MLVLVAGSWKIASGQSTGVAKCEAADPKSRRRCSASHSASAAIALLPGTAFASGVGGLSGGTGACADSGDTVGCVADTGGTGGAVWRNRRHHYRRRRWWHNANSLLPQLRALPPRRSAPRRREP